MALMGLQPGPQGPEWGPSCGAKEIDGIYPCFHWEYDHFREEVGVRRRISPVAVFLS